MIQPQICTLRPQQVCSPGALLLEWRIVRETIIAGVLFDFDSTLTLPGSIDFRAIKQRMECPAELTILDFIDSLSDESRRSAALAVLTHNERIAAEAALPADGAEELVGELRGAGYAVAILTRNSRDSIERSLKNFAQLEAHSFDTVVTRDDPVAVKPDPQSVHFAAARMGVAAAQLLMVGDHYHDIAAGRDAGSWTCLITHGTRPRPEWADTVGADYEINTLEQLRPILEQHRPLPNGKLANPLLRQLLEELQSPRGRPDVIIDAAVGRDFAAFDPALVSGPAALVVAKSDPITFATARPGSHLVTVNANDLICSGALPRWFLCSALLPPRTTLRTVRDLLQQVDTACSAVGAALIGGHTEITDAVTRPLLSGTMLGSCTAAVLRGYHSRSGRLVAEGADHTHVVANFDRVLMTKSAAVEGTLILASAMRDTLLRRGVAEDHILEALRWEEKLSVVPEARLALGYAGVRLLHDVTEGGVATALRELAAAARAQLAIERAKIPLAGPTHAICAALGLDPLGLIGSGSLLLIAVPETASALLQAFAEAGIAACDIGSVLSTAQAGVTGDLPQFEVDELARMESQR